MVADWVHDLNNGITTGSNNYPACYYDLDNLTWSGRAISNSVTPALWKSIEKDLSIDASGPEIFSMLIMKQKFLNASTARKMVNDFSEMSLIKEPRQDVDNLGNKISELAKKLRDMDLPHLI